MKQEPRLVLKPGREKSLRHRHPWIFSGAVERVEGNPEAGETVAVVAHDGGFLARAGYCPQSQIRARVWSFDPARNIDAAFVGGLLSASLARRSAMAAGSNAMRLVHGESDGLPGLVVDRYDDTLVVQILSAAAERWREFWAPALVELTGAKRVYERSDVEVRGLEGLAPRVGPMLGGAPGPIRIEEDGIAYEVDVAAGQKTGFYLDQR
ncbi:MAG TPA: 23S rRNA (cytosine(1962)-C(5))-methyltransferase RlmI, partial [Usitatibacter sp.]|nr:23S rRNA (cytosine(1962)-C(5))-methyltransferase RlmI [Usitatibacter sp.]